MRDSRQYTPIIILLALALLVFGAFVVVTLTNRDDDGDLIQTEEASATNGETTAEATESVQASVGESATDEASAQSNPEQTEASSSAGAETQGAPTPTSRSRAADSILIGTQVTPVLQSTAAPQSGADGTTTPTSMSRSTRSILIGTEVTPVLQSTAIPQRGSGMTVTPTSMSRVTQSIVLGAQPTAEPNDSAQTEGESTEEATPEATEQVEGAAGGSAAGSTMPPPESALPFADRNDVPSVLHPQGPVAAQQASLWWIMLGIGGVIYVVVMAFVLRVVSTRHRTQEYVPSNRRVLGLIVGGGVVVPMIVITLLFALTLGTMAVLALNDEPDVLTIEVVGWQWWWEVRYPQHNIVTANEIHIPVGQRVHFQLTAGDVIHSFWVPELGGKMDLMSGRVNELWLQADFAGEFRGQCAEFCGRQHAKMAILVVAQEQADFDAWLQSQQQVPTEPADELIARGKNIFLNAQCIACHTVDGTNAQGAQGPNLTHFGSRRWIGAGAVPNTDYFLEAWIVNSQSIKPGNLMPPQDIPAEDLPSLIAYLHSLD